MHRILFQIGNFPVYTYGVMVALAIFAGYLFVIYRNRNIKAATNEQISDFFILLLLGGIAGARILYVMLHLDSYMEAPLSVFNLRAGGLALHGALIASVFVFIYYTKSKKISTTKFLDLFAPPILLGIAIGRIGCFFNGCCVGMEAQPPWGMIFADAGITSPRYPTQLYELILDLLAVFVLLYWEKKTKFSGEIFVGSFFLYAVIRFLLECFRESPPRFFSLSIAQYFSILVFIVTLIWLIKARKNKDINIFKKNAKISKKTTGS